MVGTAKNHLLQLKVGGVKNAFFKKESIKTKENPFKQTNPTFPAHYKIPSPETPVNILLKTCCLPPFRMTGGGLEFQSFFREIGTFLKWFW